MNCSGTNTSGAIPVPHGVGLKKSLVSILPGLGDTGSSVRNSQRRRINSAKELTVQYQPGGLFQLLHQCASRFHGLKEQLSNRRTSRLFAYACCYRTLLSISILVLLHTTLQLRVTQQCFSGSTEHLHVPQLPSLSMALTHSTLHLHQKSQPDLQFNHLQYLWL